MAMYIIKKVKINLLEIKGTIAKIKITRDY